MNTKTILEIIENISNPEKVGTIPEVWQEELRNSELSLIDNAIIEAYLLERDGNILEAIEKWRSIANIAKGIDNVLTAHAWFSIGGLLLNRIPEDALLAYDNAINLKPDNAIFYNNRGATKSLLEQYESAISDFDEAIHLNPEYMEAYYNRGRAKDVLNNHEEAISDYNEALHLKPDYAEAYNYRGIAKCALEQHEAAITDFNEGIRLKPEDAHAYFIRGHAKDMLGYYEAAISDFDECIKREPNCAQAYSCGDMRKMY